MERPLGPRAPPPSDRNRAFESIFGRPSAAHHAGQQQHVGYLQPAGPSYPQRAPSPSGYAQQQQASYSAPYPPLPQQQYYPTPPETYATDVYPQQQPPPTVRHSITYKQPLPQRGTFEAPLPNGMTPAQAYQAQVYRDETQNQVAALPPGAAPPRNLNGRLSGVDNIQQQGSQRVPSMHQDVRPGAPSLPPLPSVSSEPMDLRFDMDSAEGLDMGSRKYSLRQPLPSDNADTQSLIERPVALDTSIPRAPPRHRYSNDSAQTLPSHLNPATRPRAQYALHHRRSSTTDGRPASLTSATRTSMTAKASLPALPGTRNSNSSIIRRAPTKPIYPALLSRVAEAFQTRIILAERAKDGLAYKDAFDGREAVTALAEIIRTTDRNLALLLGRALDAQKFFHDVTYDHRLRDSSGEVYQFRTALPNPFMAGDEIGSETRNPAQNKDVIPTNRGSRPPQRPSIGMPGASHSSSTTSTTDSGQHQNLSQSGVLSDATSSTLMSPITPSSDDHRGSFDEVIQQQHPPANATLEDAGGSRFEARDAATAAATAAASDELPLPSGVFTLLSECYSPTCTRDRLCYSIACPRRLEQQARLNLQPRPVLKRAISQESLGDLIEPGTLWIHSVSAEVAEGVSERERRRQEAINEIIYTERDFVRDMEYLRDQWVKPLSTRDIIPLDRRADFVTQVFWNVHEIIAVNTRLRDSLTKRQKHRSVVETIGDVLLEHVPAFEPFVTYGAHQLYGKYEFEKEKNSNPTFAAFVDEVERRPESRKLELNGYLTKPTTRLARYPLLLEACLKVTDENNPDATTIPKVVKLVRGFLERVNVESGRTENRFNLLQLDQQLVPRLGEVEELRLLAPDRELVYKGPLKRAQGDNTDLQLFLFDHALLIVKAKSKHEQFKVYRKPIPLELLLISPSAEDPGGTWRGGAPGPGGRSALVTKRNSTGKSGPVQQLAGMHPLAPIASDKADPKGGFPITFIHLGRKGYALTLWAATYIGRKKWLDGIVKQQEGLRTRSHIFEPWTMTQSYFATTNRVNCAAPLNRGRGVIFGTDQGVYFADMREPGRDPVKMLTLPEVTQVDVLEDYQLLIVLSERSVITFPLEALDPRDPTAGLKRAKRVSSHTSFFKAGMCLNRMLVCVVKASALSTTIKTLEPIDQNLRGKNKPTFKKLLQGGNDTLRVFKEFYIPVESSSIHFLRTKLCVGCTKGFEIVDLETLDAQGLLDPNDASLDFVQKRDTVRPMAIYRVDSEFLLCYEDFAFYINKNGWRSRPGWIIHWEGTPTAFALHYPYVLAFEPSFIEVRHVETGLMAQVIPGINISCLFADTPPSADSAAPHNNYPFPHHPYPSQGGAPPRTQLGRQSVYSQQQSMPLRPSPYVQTRRDVHKRDEIILAMDDRVVGLRLSAPPQRSDTTSTVPSYATHPR